METLVAKITDVEVSFGTKDLLQIETLTVYDNDRIGIIGQNGAGKTTLLKILAGELLPEKGRVQRQLDFNYYRQIADPDQQIEELDWQLLSRLNVPDHDLQTLSGGEAAKFRLTETLSHYQMGLLLDEPTTHLDQAGIEALIQELTYYYGTLLIVSHDRYFLDQLVTKIWEVADGTVREYPGNYAAYLQLKEAERVSQERALESYQREKQQLQKAIEKKREQAAKMARVSDKQKKRNVRPDRLASSKQKDTAQKNVQKTAKVLEGRLERLTTAAAPPREQAISFPVPHSLAIHNPYPIRGEGVTLIRGTKEILRNSDFQFAQGKKIAITGANGAGKSTLLQWIVEAGAGIVLSPKVRFSVYQQLAYQIDSQDALLDYLAKQSEYPEKILRSLLNNLGFSQLELHKKVSELSGGEATRVALALVFVRPANVLVLDEPTNFIDVTTITALQKLMKEYPGMVLFTSHDNYFVREVAEEIYRLENGKLIKN